MKKKNLETIINKFKQTFFPFYKSKKIKFIFNILEEGEDKNKDIAMFVGGCVRKHILNEEIDDIDIATVFTPEEIKKNRSYIHLKSWDELRHKFNV